MDRCPNCGWRGNGLTCPECGAITATISDPPLTTSGPRGLLATWFDAAVHPTRFYGEPQEQRSRWHPLVSTLVPGLVLAPAAGLIAGFEFDLPLADVLRVVGAGLVLFPPALAIGVLWEAALAHLALGRAAAGRFRDTLACTAYLQGLIWLRLIPIVSVVGTIWAFFAMGLGFRRLFATSKVRTTVAVLIPTVVSLVVAFSLRFEVLEAFEVSVASMSPALDIGEHIFVNKLAYRGRPPGRGDIVAFHHPREPQKLLIKRVIGVPGDQVDFGGSRPALNGQLLEQRMVPGDCSYLDEDGNRQPIQRPCRAFTESLGDVSYTVYRDPSVQMAEPSSPPPSTNVVVPEGYVFVLGDNRDESMDSRYFGPVPSSSVLGKVFLRHWSVGPAGVRWDRLFR